MLDPRSYSSSQRREWNFSNLSICFLYFPVGFAHFVHLWFPLPRGSHDAVDVRERILLRPSKAILEASDAWIMSPAGHAETVFLTGRSPSEVQVLTCVCLKIGYIPNEIAI